MNHQHAAEATSQGADTLPSERERERAMPPIGTDNDFSADDQEILASLGLDHDEDTTDDQQATAATGEDTSSSKATTSEQDGGATLADDQQIKADGTDQAGQSDAAADEQAADGTTEPQRGNVNHALRAARRAERRAKEEAARARAELEELRKKVPTQAQTGDEDDEVIRQLEDDFPEAAARLRAERAARIEAEKRAQEAAKTTATQPEAEFDPVALDPDTQDLVDSIPDLSLWHSSREHQDKWNMAVAMDQALAAHPVWSKKPVEERTAEAVRRVKAELEPATTQRPAQKESAREKAARSAKPATVPETLSDFGGGTTVSTESNLAKFTKMKSDDDILAALDS